MFFIFYLPRLSLAPSKPNKNIWKSNSLSKWSRSLKNWQIWPKTSTNRELLNATRSFSPREPIKWNKFWRSTFSWPSSFLSRLELTCCSHNTRTHVSKTSIWPCRMASCKMLSFATLVPTNLLCCWQISEALKTPSSRSLMTTLGWLLDKAFRNGVNPSSLNDLVMSNLSSLSEWVIWLTRASIKSVNLSSKRREMGRMKVVFWLSADWPLLDSCPVSFGSRPEYVCVLESELRVILIHLFGSDSHSLYRNCRNL